MVNDTTDRSFGEVTEAEDSENVQDSESLEETKETEEVKEETESQETDEKVTEETKEVSEDEDKGEETKLTEKGTKLDPNPLSAVHQQLANEKRVRQQMEQVLSNPQLLAQYMKQQFGGIPEEKKEEEQTVKEYKAEDFNNLEDVASVVNSLQKNFADKTKDYEGKITQLSNTVSVLTQRATQGEIVNNIKEDIGSLKSIKELDSESPEYIEGLEGDIVSLYQQLDFDNQTGLYKGQYSIAEIGKRMVEAAKKAKTAGSLKAQTIIKKKAEGRVTTSPKVDEDVDEDKIPPGDSIAKGISKLFK